MSAPCSSNNFQKIGYFCVLNCIFKYWSYSMTSRKIHFLFLQSTVLLYFLSVVMILRQNVQKVSFCLKGKFVYRRDSFMQVIAVDTFLQAFQLFLATNHMRLLFFFISYLRWCLCCCWYFFFCLFSCITIYGNYCKWWNL